jgi:hypothetical protein
MALFGRRLRPPAELRSLLASGERLLAMAEDGPTAVAATQFGLWLPTGPGWRRIDWDQVVKASWSEDGLYLIEGVRDGEGMVTDRPALVLRLAEPRNLPAVVKTRVEASIARWEQVRVPGGTGRIVARRKPGTDGLVWTARLDTGTPDSAAARAVLAGYLERAAKLTPEQLFPT